MPLLKPLTVQTTAKLILSGEHAVVYGHPAVAIAVNRYLTAQIMAHDKEGVTWHLPDVSYQHHHPWEELLTLYQQWQQQYEKFQAGQEKITNILSQPFALPAAAFMHWLAHFKGDVSAQKMSGIKISLTSDIPIGCGMGSSAAVIVGLMQALALFFHQSMNYETCFSLAKTVENWQHGRSSGLDVHLALQGGVVWWQNGIFQSRPVPAMPFLLINTGTPLSTTGECVSQARRFLEKSYLGNDFAAVTHAVDQSLQRQDQDSLSLIPAVRENHRLLTQIGVVPEGLQRFIKKVEKLGGAAKICGAGAIRGESAGVVWLVTEEIQKMLPLIAQHQYSQFSVKVE